MELVFKIMQWNVIAVTQNEKGNINGSKRAGK